MKEELCNAFCSELSVTSVPAGLAVGTTFMGQGGDRIGFYIIGPNDAGHWFIQDDGATIPYLEASGADLGIGARADAFKELLDQHGVTYDEETFELKTESLQRSEVPQAAMRFVALMLRVQDLLFMTRERGESTFEQEVMRDLTAALGEKASIERDAIIAPQLRDYPADIVFRAPGQKPVGLFFGVSENKVYEALLLHFAANYQLRIPCNVVAILEKDAAIRQKIRQRADNNIIVPRYKGDEAGAIGRVVETILGERPPIQMH